jgi:hypothetical protein
VLACLDCRLQVLGPEMGWAGQEDDIDPRIDHFLVGIEAEEFSIGDLESIS